MPDFRKTSSRSRASTASISIKEHMRRQTSVSTSTTTPAETPITVDGFDEALDLLAKGIQMGHIADPVLAALVDSAMSLHRDGGGGASGTESQVAGMQLDPEEKQMIWEDVMRSRHPEQVIAGNTRPVVSAAHPGSIPQPQLLKQAGTSAGPPHMPVSSHRPSPAGWFRARIDIQPVVTMVLVAALLVAIVAGYRGFGGGGGSLVTPTASAHGNQELAAIGSPESTPATVFPCDVSGTPVAEDNTGQSHNYGYEKRGPISEAQAASIPDLMGRFAGCMYGLNYQGLASVATSRFVSDLQQGISGTPEDLAVLQRRSSALNQAWSGPLSTGSQPVHVAWKTSNGTIESFNLFLNTAQRLDDGRIGMLATIAPEDVSPVPNEMWVTRNDTAMLSVWFIGFQETDEGLRVDGMFGMCGGSGCVPMFGADAATPEASPDATPMASPVVRP